MEHKILEALARKWDKKSESNRMPAGVLDGSEEAEIKNAEEVGARTAYRCCASELRLLISLLEE